MRLNLKHLAVILSVLSQPALASPTAFSTRELDGKDYAEMTEITNRETRACYKIANRNEPAPTESIDGEDVDDSGVRQTPELRSCLKNVVALVLSRREQNDPVQRELLKKTLFEIQENHRVTVLQEIAQDAIARYKEKKDDKAAQATAYEQVKNVLAEAKSRLKSEKDDVTPILQLVHKADLTVDSKLLSYRANGPSGASPNLSDKAEEILESKP